MRGLTRNKTDKEWEESIVDEFHKLYYDNAQQTWLNTRWFGVLVEKCPLDLWVYQEILTELRPDVIIETGTFRGGSALFLAHVCDLLGNGRIVTVDIEDSSPDGYERPTHPRINYIHGSSTSEETFRKVGSLIESNSEKVMVVLDSDHSEDHVLEELIIYSQLVSEGQYLIVEDGNIGGNPVLPDFGPGPREAINKFLAAHEDFVPDTAREKFYLTFNPRGFLLRGSGRPMETPHKKQFDPRAEAPAEPAEDQAQVNKREAQLKVSEAQVREMEAQIQAIYNSRSWRLTDPLRRLRAWIIDRVR